MYHLHHWHYKFCLYTIIYDERIKICANVRTKDTIKHDRNILELVKY